MTYKQIEGIDVRECQHYGKCSTYCYAVDEPCSDNPNCYYKQLKRLRQETNIYIQKLEKIEPLAIGLKQTDYQHIRQVGEKILQIIRGEE